MSNNTTPNSAQVRAYKSTRWIKCKLGQHDWFITVKSVTLNGRQRECFNCSKVEVANGRHDNFKQKWKPKDNK